MFIYTRFCLFILILKPLIFNLLDSEEFSKPLREIHESSMVLI